MADRNIKDEIQRLVDLVDREYVDRRWSRKGIMIWVVFYVIFNTLAIFIVYYLIKTLVPFITTPEIYVAFFLGTVAVYLTIINFITRIEYPFKLTPKQVIEWNYKKIKKKGCEEDPLLLSLITMKNKQPKLPLSKLDKSFLDSKRLIERLYE